MDTNSAKALKPIEIFKPGSFIAANGTKHSFTAEQLREMVDAYNPEFSDAPLVVGHPKTNDPRFGRASSLFINDAGVVCAVPDEVCPEFAEAVNAKHYKQVSASIYLPNAPGNPVPGKHYLRHIGFLGGAAPAVKGLKSVEFAAAEDGVVEFSYEDRLVVRLFRSIRDWITAKDGVDKAQEIISDYDLDYLTEAAIREDLEGQAGNRGLSPAFSEPTISQEDALNLAQQQQALKAREDELNARAATLAKQESAIKKTAHADFAEALCTEGKLLPAQKASVVEIMCQLDAANQVADFAAGDENHGKTGAELFKAFLAAQLKQVEFSRVSKPAGETAGTADFAAPPGTEVNPESMELFRMATQYQKDNPGVDIIAAAKAVAK